MPRHSSALACVAALVTGLTVVAPPAARAAEAQRARVAQSHYAFSGSGFGSRVGGGDVPAGSGTTAYQHIGCTNKTGLSRTNALAQQDLTGIGRLTGMRTRVWTTARRGVVTSHARHRIDRLSISTAAGTVAVTGITAAVRASHDAAGYHATTTGTVGAITLTPVVGPVTTFAAPTPGHPLSILGLVTLSVGTSVTHVGSTGAQASGSALKVEVAPTGTKVVLARAHATIAGGVTFGLFHGRSNASQVSALDDSLRSGPQPLTIMPCQGTAGRAHSKSLAHADLAGVLSVDGLSSRDVGDQSATRAHGVEVGKVTHVRLGDVLTVDGIVGRASVTRTDHHVTRTARGTTAGTVTVNGVVTPFPRSGVLDVPGVATLERSIVHRTRTGISVTALRITLLDGSGAVIDLGQGQLRIGKLRHHRH